MFRRVFEAYDAHIGFHATVELDGLFMWQGGFASIEEARQWAMSQEIGPKVALMPADKIKEGQYVLFGGYHTPVVGVYVQSSPNHWFLHIRFVHGETFNHFYPKNLFPTMPKLEVAL
jgi:hypothetical protein